MYVKDQRKWLRAKQKFTALLAVLFICAIGGLEGTGRIPFPQAAALLFVGLAYMTHNITKHY